jgi:cellobiose transport system permease protein
MFIYEQTFVNFDVGRGAATSWLLFLLIIVFALINFALLRRSLRGNTS